MQIVCTTACLVAFPPIDRVSIYFPEPCAPPKGAKLACTHTGARFIGNISADCLGNVAVGCRQSGLSHAIIKPTFNEPFRNVSGRLSRFATHNTRMRSALLARHNSTGLCGRGRTTSSTPTLFTAAATPRLTIK